MLRAGGRDGGLEQNKWASRAFEEQSEVSFSGTYMVSFAVNNQEAHYFGLL